MSPAAISRYLTRGERHACLILGVKRFSSQAQHGLDMLSGLRAAPDGANIVIAAKTVKPHSKLPGTIRVRRPTWRPLAAPHWLSGVTSGMKSKWGRGAQAVETFRKIVCRKPRDHDRHTDTPMRRYDLMHQINARGTFATTQACLPHLMKAENPHVLTLASPINLDPKWFAKYTAYTMAKYGMSLCVIGHAAEFRQYGIAVNGLWPATLIATAALNLVPVPLRVGELPT